MRCKFCGVDDRVSTHPLHTIDPTTQACFTCVMHSHRIRFAGDYIDRELREETARRHRIAIEMSQDIAEQEAARQFAAQLGNEYENWVEREARLRQTVRDFASGLDVTTYAEATAPNRRTVRWPVRRQEFRPFQREPKRIPDIADVVGKTGFKCSCGKNITVERFRSHGKCERCGGRARPEPTRECPKGVDPDIFARFSRLDLGD